MALTSAAPDCHQKYAYLHCVDAQVPGRSVVVDALETRLSASFVPYARFRWEPFICDHPVMPVLHDRETGSLTKNCHNDRRS